MEGKVSLDQKDQKKLCMEGVYKLVLKDMDHLKKNGMGIWLKNIKYINIRQE